jgi:DNA-binding GntR family transcriptional regulator
MSEVDSLTEKLKRAIICCDIPPGTYVIENQLVEEHKSTKAKVRTALRKLMLQGFIEPIPRVGHMVTVPTRRDVQETFELRTMLEAWIAKDAAKKATESDIAYLSSLRFSISSDEEESITKSLQANHAFHNYLAHIAGNRQIAAIVDNLLDKVHRVLHMGLVTSVKTGEMVDEHEWLIAAIQEGNPEKAEAIAIKQMEEAQEMIFEAIDAYLKTAEVGLRMNRSHTIRK